LANFIHKKKLKDFTPDMWRYRIRAWRIFYQIEEDFSFCRDNFLEMAEVETP